MLSLNSDSRQQHYIGSSSGLLFTSLIGLNNQHNDNERRENMRKQSSPRDSTEIAFEKRARVSRSNAKYMDAFGLLQEKLRSVRATLAGSCAITNLKRRHYLQETMLYIYSRSISVVYTRSILFCIPNQSSTRSMLCMSA